MLIINNSLLILIFMTRMLARLLVPGMAKNTKFLVQVTTNIWVPLIASVHISCHADHCGSLMSQLGRTINDFPAWKLAYIFLKPRTRMQDESFQVLECREEAFRFHPGPVIWILCLKCAAASATGFYLQTLIGNQEQKPWVLVTTTIWYVTKSQKRYPEKRDSIFH